MLTLIGLIFGKPIKFIIDSGAERSVFPFCLVPRSICFPTSVELSSVDNKPLKTYGHFTAVLSVNSLRREFHVNFIATDTKPILGADFLTATGLTLNMKNKKLLDPLTNISVDLHPARISSELIRVTKSSDTKNYFKENFPELCDPPNYSYLPPDFDTEHTIETNSNPIFAKPRPLPPNKLNIAKKEFDNLLALKIVRPSNSPWSSPLHMVKKADGTWRPCGDYRRLNSVTIPDRYSIPNMNTIHHRLKGAKIFSKLDLVKAYHFIPIRAEDIPKTAICTPFGNYEYLRMPFGLRNSSSTFQRFIDGIFRDFDNAVTYLDDILIFSENEQQHLEHLSIVCKKLNSVGLKLNDKKSIYMQSKVPFLGFEFNEHGIKPLEDRIEALNNLPEPKDSKTLQRYLGMFGFYQKCIPKFSDKAKPLRDLVKSTNFNWLDIHKKAFNCLKQSLSDAVELSFPTPGASISITADASSHAIGACLHQLVDGKSTPLSFFSRQLSDTESRYSTFDRELLAIFASIKKWRHFISGSDLTIFTDHKPLIGALKCPKERPSGRQERQISFILEYITDIIHIAGKDNVVADTLSRSSINSLTITEPYVDLIEIAKAQKSCIDNLDKYKAFEITKDNSLVCDVSRPHPRPYIPQDLRLKLFNSLHQLSHPGWKATCRLIGSRYYWPSLKEDIRKWCSECQPCQFAKVSRHTKIPLGELPCPTKRFANVHIDIVGPLEPPSVDQINNPRYIITMIDAHTRWLEAIPVGEITADVVCKVFLANWVSRFGPPLYIITDRGTQFCCELLSNLTKFFGIHHIRTSAYNPKANGLIERSHRSLKAALIARGGNWLKQLPYVLLGLRMYPDEEGNSAFSRVTGEQPMVPSILLCDEQTLDEVQFPYKLPRSRSSKEFMPKELETCKHIWLRLDRVKRPLEAPYQGPFEVVSRSQHTMTILVRGKPTTVSIERVKPAKLLNNSSTSDTPPSEPDIPNSTKALPVTRSGRTVRFKSENQFHYY